MANSETGLFVWHENLTRDPKTAIEFYTDVVGWKTQPFTEGGGDYVMWVGSEGPLGGVMKLPEEVVKMGALPHWLAYVGVENVDATASLATSLGGKVHKEPSDIPGVGRFAVIGDPQGALIAVIASSSPMTPHDPSKVGEFCWNELMTTNSQTAFTFYTQLFGWKVQQEMDMGPMGTYRIFGIGERSMGGMMTIPMGAPMPPTWIYYAETPDLDAALGRATKRGAKVMNGPMEVPGGRIAQITDSQGAVFALHQAVKK